MADQPNILIIMSDEHAPQYSSVYGHSLVQSPNMERMAARRGKLGSGHCESQKAVGGCGRSRAGHDHVHRSG